MMGPIPTDGAEKVLHFFSGRDGAIPSSSLLYANGTLYGTTFSGGAHSYGTVYRISTTGHEKVIYSFKGLPDAARPEHSGLINVKGTLYGSPSTAVSPIKERSTSSRATRSESRGRRPCFTVL